jgi:hypothetical protein
MIATASSSSIAAFVPARGGAATSVTDAAPTPAEEKQRQAEKLKLQQLQGALTTLKGLHDSSKSTAAGLAQQKLEALKQRLKMLMMFGGDPKQIAKEAAQIAKEIGQAAKDYANAVGGGSSGSTSAEPQAADAATGPAPAADAPSPTATPQDATAVAATGEQSAAAAASVAGADPTKATGDTSTDTTKTDPTSATPKPATAPSASHGSGPDPVIEEAKQLAARAKAILQAAIAKAKLQHADPAELQRDQNEMSDAEKAIRDAEKALGAGDAPSSYSADGQATAPPPAAAPTVSVQA